MRNEVVKKIEVYHGEKIDSVWEQRHERALTYKISRSKRYKACSDFSLEKSERAHAAAPPSKSQARTGLRFAFYHEAMVSAASETPSG